MNRANLRLFAFASVFSIVSCATSMTPSRFLEEFPSSTSTISYDRPSADEAISSGKCDSLVGGRKYTSPIGLTVYGDLQNGASGVDEWVQADRGNSYVVNNFEWVSVGDQGTTQLIIYFDTMLCK